MASARAAADATTGSTPVGSALSGEPAVVAGRVAEALDAVGAAVQSGPRPPDAAVEVAAAGLRPLIVGIGGGSGSGKTSISSIVAKRIGSEDVTILTHDSYYRDLGSASFEERKAVNFDHPSALETELLIEHIKQLRAGKTVDVPVYDFATHSRLKDETVEVRPTPVIIVDGILIFSDPGLRELIDIKIYVDTDADIRFIRRLRRDTQERGRTSEEVAEQYLKTVRPMHIMHVEPTKRFADVIIPEGGYDSHVAMDMLMAHMNACIDDRRPERRSQRNLLGTQSDRPGTK